YVAKITNHIYDWYEPSKINRHLVDLVITVIFNKVKKEVIVIKDVKLVPPAKFEVQPLHITVNNTEISVPVGYLVQLSNREEWDLGLLETGTTSYSSYVHFYQNIPSSYNKDWTMLPTLPAKTKIKGYADEVNKEGSFPGPWGRYDVAQIISNDKQYVGWHAFWPRVSDWSVTAGDDLTWYRALWDDDPHTTDGYSEPWRSPLVVGEWDFMLSDQHRELDSVVTDIQFRGVSVYGVTDRHDGEDEDMGSTYDNIIDSEVDYQLREVFKPWDLLKAVHKDTKRWVEWTTASSITLKHKPFNYVNDTDWDEYCAFSERVYDYTTGELLKRGDYTLSYNSISGIATISGLTSGHTYKILYSTKPDIFECKNITVTDIPVEIELVEDIVPPPLTLEDKWTDKLGVTHGVSLEINNITVTNTTEISQGNYIVSESFYLEGESKFKVYMGEVHKGWVKDLENFTFEDDNWKITVDLGRFKKNITSSNDPDVTWPLDSETVHVKYLGHKLYITVNITVENGETISGKATLTLSTCYREELGGRYEWTVVGKDAATVDSAGAALVTAAFKNKQVEIGLAGEDMYDTVIANQMPWVMRKFGAGNTKADYYYSATDKRTALRDDWCKAGTVNYDEWPIASSNMIGVGGPIANLLAYYGNDFMQALFGLGEFTTHTPWKNKIVPLTCWDMTKTSSYASSNTVGYAVISTYKDINGTVLFLIWGHWGRDTYYVTKWFHEEGIYQLQEAPKGLTGIIVKITYESTDEGYKPTGYSIVECLGTISETLWVHNNEIKGGIHDP
ncbi:hypothetical protein KEJ44_09240, partial [Candidatus Bathyarchaeota archaeon]|nr:hypothetical protein [Candidatus Bathyarchaeota archaeon]